MRACRCVCTCMCCENVHFQEVEDSGLTESREWVASWMLLRVLKWLNVDEGLCEWGCLYKRSETNLSIARGLTICRTGATMLSARFTPVSKVRDKCYDGLMCGFCIWSVRDEWLREVVWVDMYASISVWGCVLALWREGHDVVRDMQGRVCSWCEGENSMLQEVTKGFGLWFDV